MRRGLATMAVLAALLVGCSSDSDGGGAATSTPVSGDEAPTSSTGDPGEDDLGEHDPGVVEPGPVDLSADEQAFADEITAAVVDSGQSGVSLVEEASMTEEQARCFAEHMVDGIGVDRLVEMGFTPESFAVEADLGSPDISDAEALAFADAFFGCIDLRQLLIDDYVAQGVSQEGAECMADELEAVFNPSSFSSLLTASDDAMPLEAMQLFDVMFNAPGRCLTDEEQQIVNGL